MAATAAIDRGSRYVRKRSGGPARRCVVVDCGEWLGAGARAVLLLREALQVRGGTCRIKMDILEISSLLDAPGWKGGACCYDGFAGSGLEGMVQGEAS